MTAVSAACTPIAPSIHKSVLRTGDSEKNRTSVAPQPQSLQRLSPERKEGELKITWVRDDESLDEELGPTGALKRATDDEITELKTLADGKLMVIALPEDWKAQDHELRVVVRVQVASARLEEIRSSEEAEWSFWLHESRKAVAVSQALEKSQLGAAILNVYLVSEKR